MQCTCECIISAAQSYSTASTSYANNINELHQAHLQQILHNMRVAVLSPRQSTPCHMCHLHLTGHLLCDRIPFQQRLPLEPSSLALDQLTNEASPLVTKNSESSALDRSYMFSLQPIPVDTCGFYLRHILALLPWALS